ncbi:uncharacterized protein SPSK_00846 [Sporothrix schenckii 1099-18]|uniref:Methyltransferase domain-containing protein n=1 Tax=Sporothrix schenckii 1099-18 TaxID=1397361 RepID=A0A0F2LYK3_SPOSC|nr:uncharacterized protein SPSK_00846 [Sporothrix schenckii 1099-18]KJR81570.1 hypothetical protein SPSK_00846 [Sporothrix schenckii 1099-18]
MASEKKDIWSTEAGFFPKYQNAASFVPKLVGKVIGWLDVQKDDVILDLGCGDGVLDLQFAEILSKGTGRLHGVDSSPSLIETSQKAVEAAGYTNSTFEGMWSHCVKLSHASKQSLVSHTANTPPRRLVYDANDIVDKPELQKGQFNKAFSNAAMHWILSNTAKHEQFFHGVQNALQPGGVFVFEMGGLGNVTELVTGVVSSVSRRIGLEAAKKANPWFFPDEAWARDILENRVGGWKVEKIEREWRETPADAGGIDGWIRLMARPFLDAVPEAEREACTREIVEVLEYTTRTPKGSHTMQYVRLRVQARKL